MAYTNTPTETASSSTTKASSRKPNMRSGIESSARENVVHETSAMKDASNSQYSQRIEGLLSEVRSQGEALLGRAQSLAHEYGIEATALRGMVTRTTQKNPVAVILGAACVGFCAGLIVRGVAKASKK